MNPLAGLDLSSLKILKYPDPRLRGPCQEVGRTDAQLGALAGRMLEIMYAARGVGLAAPQLGIPLRLFVANPAGQPGQQQVVYVNPQILQQSGAMMEEEGCLSLPGINCRIKRYRGIVLGAVGLDGRTFQQAGENLLARIFQHEMDHVNGILIADRMSLVTRLANRRLLKELEEKFAALSAPGR
jgi:peptide deformylase